MKSHNQLCNKRTQHVAQKILSAPPTKSYPLMIEQVIKRGAIECPQLEAGKLSKGKKNEEICIALVRPLGSLSHHEEKEAVKELGEPYQLELLAAVLTQAGYQVKIFDQLAGPYDPANPSNYPATKTNEQLIMEVEGFCPDAVGFGTFTYNFRRGLAIAAELKKKLGIPIIFGGYHVTSVGKQYLLFDSFTNINPAGSDVFKQDLRNVFQHGIVDYACIGEGIRTILDIMDVLKGEKDPQGVQGIAFMKDGKLCISGSPRMNLDDYPLPFRGEGVNPMMYYATGRGYPFLLLMTASGCRFSCEYCSTATNYPGLRFRSVEDVVEELRQIAAKFYPTWPAEKIMINITDEDFAASPRRIIELCNTIVAEGLNQYFEFNSFLDNMSILGPSGDEMLEAMRRAGFVFCFIGIESMLESAVVGYDRPDKFKNRLTEVQQAIDKMARHRVLYFGDHIAGYPEHTLVNIEEDYSQLFGLRRMHYVYFPILAPMPGTPLYWRTVWGLLGEGFLPDITYDHLDANRQVVAIRGGDVKTVRDDAVQGFFTRTEYEQDANEAIAKNPAIASFFSKMLRKVSEDYPLNEALRKLAEKYTLLNSKR